MMVDFTRLRYLPIRLACLWLFLSGVAAAQTAPNPNPVYTNSHYTNQRSIQGVGNAVSATLALPGSVELTHQLQTAVVQIQLDAGEPYPFGNIAFEATLKTDVKAVRADGTESLIQQGCVLKITNQAPVALYSKSFLPSDVTQLKLYVTTPAVITVKDTRYASATQKATLQTTINTALRLTLRYDMAYRIQVAQGTAPVTLGDLQASPLGPKTYRLSWKAFLGQTPTVHVPNYQLQLLRLYNQEDLATSPDLQSGAAVRTTLDWSKALSLETESSQSFVDLTLAEGSGFYAWRVRPIGSFYKGGMSNAQNYGVWSTQETAAPVTFTRNTLVPGFCFFYFTDPDADKNFIYSRTFTEGNRVSEKITYASALQQARQTQAHLPSKDTTILTQTIYDYSSRPAITTLPVPVADPAGLSGYKPGMVRPANEAGIYSAKDFDQEGDPSIPSSNTIIAPKALEQQNTPFTYYGGVQHNVPNAEGYPFTRSRYDNDGTNRVIEQSGVGKQHAIGTGPEKGRTVKSYTETASETELIRLFGDEAPAANSVLKTITVDQNNTASVTYTSKEGKVIATCLSYKDQSITDGLLAAGEGDDIEIQDTVRSNLQLKKGIVASKRVSFLTPTILQVNYQLGNCPDPAKLGCYDVSLKCSYDLRVYIKKVDGGTFSSTLTKGAWKPSLSQPEGATTPPLPYTVLYQEQLGVACQSNLIDFGQVELPAGSYIVEKQLISRSSDTEVKLAQEKVEEQITPLANLIKTQVGKATCDLQVYEFYAFLKELQDDLRTAKAKPDAVAISVALQALDTKYKVRLLAAGAKPGNATTPFSFFTPKHEIRLTPDYNRTAGQYPKTVLLSSACCQDLSIPLNYMPVFDFSKVTMATTKGQGGSVSVNPFLLVEGDGKAQTEFFPDFEGYAYHFFWNCTPPLGAELNEAIVRITNDFGAAKVTAFNSSYLNFGNATIYTNLQLDPNVVQQKLQYIYFRWLAPHLTGWEEPGTFNLMVQHMLKDTYDCNGTAKVKDENGNLVDKVIEEKPPVSSNTCAAGCVEDPNIAGGKCPYYRGEDLFRCWVAQLSYLQNTLNLCPGAVADAALPEDQQLPYNVSKSIDKEKNDGGATHDNHVDINVKGGWLMKFFMNRKVKKMSQRIRKMQDPNLNDPDFDERERIAAGFNYHLVNEFLNCTGYRFAKIITDKPDGSAATPHEPLPADKDSDFNYTNYSNHPVFPRAPLPATWKSYTGKDRQYQPNGNWWVIYYDKATKTTPIDTLFKYIKDPVYAFKYLEYKDQSRPFVELSTCYKDPNLDAQGKPLCTDINGKAELCNFCGIGRVRCTSTSATWSCGQRYTFYMMLEKHRDQPPTDWEHKELVVADYTSPGYVDRNEQETKVFVPWQETTIPEYSATQYTSTLVPSFDKETRLKTKVEIDISDLNLGLKKICEMKESEFARILKELLLSRCYQIGGCKTAVDDNIIPVEDFGLLVNLMVEECKKRGEINTYRVNATPCLDYSQRMKDGYPGAFYKTVSFVEYGVFDPGTPENPNPGANCQLAFVQYRQTSNGNFEVTSAEVKNANNTPIPLKATSSIGSINNPTTLLIYRCEGAADTPIPFTQHLRRKEVVEMGFKLMISLPSKCGGAPVVPLPYVLDNCTPGTDNAAIANPNEHINTPISLENATNQPVYKSPATRIEVNINQQNKVKVNNADRP
jgi:hypothetical protein